MAILKLMGTTLQVGSRIMLLEDERGIRETMKALFELEGYSVSAFGNGRECLEALSNQPHPGIFVVDLMMPVMNGWDFISEIEKNQSLASVPVIVTTAFSDDTREVRATQVFKKPMNFDLLLAAIKQSLR